MYVYMVIDNQCGCTYKINFIYVLLQFCPFKWGTLYVDSIEYVDLAAKMDLFQQVNAMKHLWLWIYG